MSVKVTIVVLTYNHERFIAKALESILAQNTDFTFQILVADDGSTDATLTIINDFYQKNPDKFIIKNNTINQGIKANILNSFSEIDGEYIAILDGDDYWQYTEKLRKQIEFLENHPDFNGVFHDAEIVHIDDSKEVLYNQKKYYSQAYTFDEMIHPVQLISRKMIFPSSSVLLRASALNLIEAKLLKDQYSLLWKLTCFVIKNSKFYFINEPWSVYHNHTKGISKSDNTQFHFSHITFLEDLLRDEYYKYYKYEIYASISGEYKILLDTKQTPGKRKLFRKYLNCELKKLWYYRKRIKANDL
ncbi:MAG: glycosyltransferase [Flavobacteriia bacterium]|nr:glycosyltransferase [Flavobacteriia bacterium]OJX36015.1 MAG: hypothetical protein BGO87_05975 [Flavobacteriia bacterium 40-80]